MDEFRNPVPGVSETNTAPASSVASGLFTNSTTTITATTNGSGQLSEAFTANTHAGAYTVTATFTGAPTPASFSLTNTAGAAASIVVASGSPQSATVNTA